MKHQLTGTIILLIALSTLVYIISNTPALVNPSSTRPQELPTPRTNVEQPSAIYSPSAVDTSPKVYISSVSVREYPDFFSTITIYHQSGDPVSITGWRVKSNRNEFLIPQAVEVYDPAGGVNLEGDIVLRPGQQLKIYSSQSAVRKNFRLNKCTGYLEETYNFLPDLPRTCPSVPREDYRGLSGQCQSYILSLGSCKLPDVNFYNSLPGTAEGNACRNFLSTINPSSCFQKYRQNSDFLSNEWWIWVNQQIFDPRHDFVQLIDKNGTIIDTYEY